MGNRDLGMLRNLELYQKERCSPLFIFIRIKERDLGNKHPKKKLCSRLTLHKEVNEYWNKEKRKPDNEEELGQETCSN